MRKLLTSALVAAASLIGTSLASATPRTPVSSTPSRGSGSHVSASHSGGVRVASHRGWSGHGGRWHGGGRWGWGGRGWGWGWGYPGYWAGGYYGPYYGAGYGYGGYAYAPGNWGAVKTDVSPEEARVFLDGRYIGTADDFDGYPDFLYLKPGRYQIEFRLDGFETQSIDVEARSGLKIEVDNKLKKIPGAKAYGSYDTPQPEGGVNRFWGKVKEQTAAINPEAEGGDADNADWRGRSPGPPPGDDEQMAEPPRDDEASPEPPRAEQPAYAPNARVSVTGARARILFRIEPADAAIYVDDRFAGTGEELSSLSRGLLVAPGTHRVVVSRPGFKSESIQVDTSAGQAETVEITLGR